MIRWAHCLGYVSQSFVQALVPSWSASAHSPLRPPSYPPPPPPPQTPTGIDTNYVDIGLKHPEYIFSKMMTFILLAETDESIQRIMDKSFKHIVIYTSKFVQNCPKTGDIILRKHNRVLRDRLVCLYEKETFKTFDHIRNRLARLICRNVYMLCPDKHDEDEVKNFKEKLRTILPTRTILKKLDNAWEKILFDQIWTKCWRNPCILLFY